MKKLFLLAALLLAAPAVMQAQSEKPRILIEKFSKNDAVSTDDAVKIRSTVMNDFANTRRFELVDAVTIADLEAEMAQRQRETADYIVNGTVLTMAYTSEINKEGKTQYGCSLSYSITMTDTKNESTLGTETFDVSASNIYDTKEEAANAAADNISKNIRNFVITYLPITGTVNPADYEAKKDKLQKCYINVGSSQGVKKGDTFKVLIPTVRAGRTTYKEVGDLKVEEVVDVDLSYCKITGKHKELLIEIEKYAALDEAAQNEKPLMIKQYVKLGLFDKATNAIGSFGF